VVAVDVGGTSIKAALVDEDGRVLRRFAVPTPGSDAVVEAVLDAIRRMTEPGVAAVGVVVPGVVDVSAGVARYSVNLGWRDVPLRDLLAAEIALPVALGHDVAAAGLAEYTLGAGRGVGNCLIVAVGTGIAAVPVVNGRPVAGATGIVGEIGHVPVYADGEPCTCGQLGCTEAYASAAAIARRYAARSGVARTAEQIAAVLDSDTIAQQVWCEAADALGLALASYTLLLDPALVVFVGGLAGAGAALRDPVQEALARRLVWRPAPTVEVSPLAGDAGLVGAALLAWRAAGRDVAVAGTSADDG
jgi:glucokinase